jgi:hypothetical protein
MNLDPEQHMVIVRSVAAWQEQAETALDEITAANGGVELAHIADAKRIAPVAFGRLIEALAALEPYTRRKVGEDLIQLAGLKPVDQVLFGDD